MSGFSGNTPSLNHNANVLVELAAYLQAGRPDIELATKARDPRSHPEVGELVESFTNRAFDEYQDCVVLLGALATKLSASGKAYEEADGHTQQLMDDFLHTTTLVTPEDHEADQKPITMPS